MAGSSAPRWGQVCALWRSFSLQGLAVDALLIFKRERKKPRSKEAAKDTSCVRQKECKPSRCNPAV